MYRSTDVGLSLAALFEVTIWPANDDPTKKCSHQWFQTRASRVPTSEGHIKTAILLYSLSITPLVPPSGPHLSMGMYVQRLACSVLFCQEDRYTTTESRTLLRTGSSHRRGR